jgi:SAM-dependent methyltransferase
MDRRTKFWQDNFTVFARTRSLESDVNVYMPHSWQRRQKVFSELATHLTEEGVLGPGKTAADIGCGSGMFSRILSATGTQVVASDLCMEMLRRARQEDECGSIMLVNADCANLPFPDASFDFVAGNGLVTILSDPEPFLKELGRVLKPGGVAMIETLNGCWLGRVKFALSSGRSLPDDIGVLHYLPGPLGRTLAKAIGADFAHTLPLVRVNPGLAFLEEPLQCLARKIPLLTLPFASSFILLARKN